MKKEWVVHDFSTLYNDGMTLIIQLDIASQQGHLHWRGVGAAYLGMTLRPIY